MFDNFFNKQKSPKRRFLFILGAAIFIAIVVFGVLIIFWDNAPFTKTQRYMFGGFFIIYGVMRFIRIINTDS